MTVLLVATTATAVVAVQQRREVDRLGLVRQSQQLVEASEALAGTDPARAAEKASEAYRTYPTAEARGRVLSAAAAASYGREISLDGAGIARTMQHNDAWSSAIVGGEIVTLGANGIDTYDAESFRHVKSVPDDGSSYIFGWDIADDGRMAVSEGNGRITLRARPDAQPELFTTTTQPVGVHFTEDGRSLLVGGTVYDLATREKRYELPVGSISGPFTIQDEKTLAVASGSSIAVWDLATRQRTGGFTLGSGIIYRVTLLPGGKLAAVGTDEGLVQVRDIASGAVVATPPSHPGGVMSLTLSPDKTVLVSAGADGKLNMWDVARGTRLATLTVGEPVRSASYTADGSLAILTDRSLKFWPPGNMPKTSGLAVRALAVDSDGSVLTVDDAGVIERRDSSLRTVHRQETGIAKSAVSRFSPDGKQVATSAPLSVLDVATGKPVANLPTLGFRSEARPPVALGFDGRSLLAIGGEVPDGVWPAADAAQPTLIGGLSWGQRTAAVFGRSDHEIVIGSEGGGVSVLDTRT
ncbi:MAG TPA: hypothetical protein VF821_25930, partial [Lentzea sp.]